ncbi:MAG: ATP-binding cassette domain-containing protein [Chloroflexota bacterium]
MLKLSHVWRTYPVGDSEVVALRDVSLTINQGDYMAIVGPSGSGKSTLLQIVGLLDRPSRGVVELDGRDLSSLGDAERTRLRLQTLGFVFQRFHLLNEMTALENVALPLEAAGVPPWERQKRAAELLADVGLADRMHFRPSRLSGGQRQRVAIARALANNPRILLADEPTGELHTEDRASVLALFRRFHEQGRAVVLVTHDMEVAAQAARRIEIRDGRVREVGVDSPLTEDSTESGPNAGRAVRVNNNRKSSKGRWLAALLAVALLAGAGGGWLAQSGAIGGSSVVPTVAPTPAPRRVARGVVRPENEASIRSIVSGVISSLSTQVGAAVMDNQELARVRAPDGAISIVTAPIRGTVVSLPVHNGDTVTTGMIIATVGDVSRLQIETDDVDEFLVPFVQVGQTVRVTIDALPDLELRGAVSEVTLQTQKTSDGDDHYPVTVRLETLPPQLRAGMTARVRFSG